MLPLVIGYAAIVAALVVVALDISLTFLARRDLAEMADGASLAASQAVDDQALYTEGLGAALPVTGHTADAAVRRYLLASGAGGVPGLRYTAGAAPDGTVTVTLRREVRLPFVAVLGLVGVAPQWRDGTVVVAATGHARSPLSGG